ncbi:amino acid permease [Lapillicoccus jejuensis]|uniref:APA family basic amino acid/polyamine antiporter n=1 Tax=Lapillicoccus jejuensis TaxID=402171 RepID=A0A542DVT7_9MICO|nr:amino acid permease [Lapillicoccus jejuensis]TQJ07166.1 APA family basic amino acid/polyamine antiporter [Lapillicoccus jejuensis]
MTTTSRRTGALRTKPVELILEQQADEAEFAQENGGSLRKNLTSRDLMGFGIGIVIGTGIFTLTGVEAKNHAGPGVVVSFAIAGVVSLLAALCYAEMASTVPTAGSAYTYAYATLGEVVAWIIGWDLILEFALGAAVVARGWSSYLANLLNLPRELFTEDAPVNVGAILITVVLGIVALVGVKESARVTNALVVIKVAVCLFVVVAGLFFVKAANLTPFVPPAQPVTSGTSGLTQPLSQALFGIQPTAFGFAGVLTAAAVVFFAYTGFEAVANMGEETRNPKKDLPLGLLGTLGICTVLYIGVSFVVTGMQQYSQIDEGAPIAGAFKSVGLGWASALISIAAVCGLTSVILVDIVAMGRIGFAMGRDHLLPPSVAAIHPKWGTPWKITLATIVLVALLGAFVPLSALADMVSIGTLFAFVVVSLAVPIMRRRRPEMERPFKVPFSPVIPVLSALACLYLMTNLSLETWLRFVVWMALGFLIYFGYGRRNASVATWDDHHGTQDARPADA